MRSRPWLSHARLARDFVTFALRVPARQRTTNAPVLRTGAKSVLVAGEGLEPSYLPPKGSVLPLDDPAMYLLYPLFYKNHCPRKFLGRFDQIAKPPTLPRHGGAC